MARPASSGVGNASGGLASPRGVEICMLQWPTTQSSKATLINQARIDMKRGEAC